MAAVREFYVPQKAETSNVNPAQLVAKGKLNSRQLGRVGQRHHCSFSDGLRWDYEVN